TARLGARQNRAPPLATGGAEVVARGFAGVPDVVVRVDEVCVAGRRRGLGGGRLGRRLAGVEYGGTRAARKRQGSDRGRRQPPQALADQAAPNGARDRINALMSSRPSQIFTFIPASTRSPSPSQKAVNSRLATSPRNTTFW